MMGGAAEGRPGMAVLLDISPTLAVRVRGGAEVADVARAPYFQLTRELASGRHAGPGRPPAPGAAVPGARAEALGQTPACCLRRRRASSPGSRRRRARRSSSSPGARCSACRWAVLQVSPVLAAFCPFPVPGGVIAGLLAHAGALWPVYSLPAFLGRAAGGGVLSSCSSSRAQRRAVRHPGAGHAARLRGGRGGGRGRGRRTDAWCSHRMSRASWAASNTLTGPRSRPLRYRELTCRRICWSPTTRSPSAR